MFSLKKKSCFIEILVAFILLGATSIFPLRSNAQKDSTAFGDTTFITNGLLGKVFLLPVTTRNLPDFDTMKPVSIIYTPKLDIPVRNWTSGFPGVPDRFEWFAIEYTGYFEVNKTGKYHFRLLSDDGSKLFIDDSLVINNDGLHGAYAKSAEVLLNDSKHFIKIDYFQGPRYQLALQLFSNLTNSKEEIFPGSNFKLYTKKPPSDNLTIILILGGIILVFFLFILWKKRKNKKNTA